MNSSCQFSVRKSKLLDILKQYRRQQKINNVNSFNLEVTIIDNFIQLVVPGFEMQISAVTSGSVKFTVSPVSLLIANNRPT